ncbi:MULTISPECIES: hypothetical protein [Bacillus cereus group]|uniref:Lipoprotein n=1 Tax=Bacillus mycoides TaxID=1405 RepID=A0A1D3MH59_BACMY|nr:hypothetical protein [Bacillus mycoides]MBJ8070761.1 hypothetical protein [Bacillus cereus]MBJ8190099.1 hypothetical protein [Bacillus cereus]OFE00295.1 hypothetical protein BWGOE11_09890 [Bacillus mycoides]OFE03398.1 hypothetical protein BWGOE13_09530 [Bacillus mycoides]OHX33162.1 hypothetical protein BWGOE5_09310 [Bacillus mycoides]
MKKIKVIFTLATSLLLLQGCNSTPSKANENTNSNTELQTLQKEKDSLEKTNKELTKKLADLESKTGKEQKTYELNKKLAQKIYSIYTGSPWDDRLEDAGWEFNKTSSTKGTISTNRGGGQVIQILSNYAIMFEMGGLDEPTISNLKVIDLNTEKVMNEYPDQNNSDSKENNKETAQKSSSPNTDKEKLKKQLTDKTFIAPSPEESGYKAKEIMAAVEDYLISNKSNPEDYQVDVEGTTDDGNTLLALRQDNHAGAVVVMKRYVLDKNGYVYEYDFFEQKAKDTPLTNIYIEGILNPKN